MEMKNIMEVDEQRSCNRMKYFFLKKWLKLFGMKLKWGNAGRSILETCVKGEFETNIKI